LRLRETLNHCLPYFIHSYFELIAGGLPLKVDVHFFPSRWKETNQRKIKKKLSPAFARQAINACGDFFRPPLPGALPTH